MVHLSLSDVLSLINQIILYYFVMIYRKYMANCRPYQALAAIDVPLQVKDTFDIFWNTQYHGCKWPKKTCAVVCTPGRGINVFYNCTTTGVHAEIKLIDYIENVLRPSIAVTLKLYINYSPCHGCAPKLMNLLNNWPNIMLDVYFTGLYYNRSDNSTTYKLRGASKNTSVVFKQFLLYGRQNPHRLQTKTFNFEVWNEFAEVLKLIPWSMQNTSASNNEARTSTPNASHLYVYNQPCEGQTHKNNTREIEDNNISKDLVDLFEKIEKEKVPKSPSKALKKKTGLNN